MSFMDKAKKVAEQAQQKLEEAQKQFNERQAGGAAAGSGPAPSQEQSSSSGTGQGQTSPQRFDEHGRPIAGEPASDAPQGGEQSEAPAPPADTPNTNPDPFKPLGS